MASVSTGPTLCTVTGLPAYRAAVDAVGALNSTPNNHRDDAMLAACDPGGSPRNAVAYRLDDIFHNLCMFVAQEFAATPCRDRGMVLTCSGIDSVVVDYGFGDIDQYTLSYLVLDHPTIAPRMARMLAGMADDANCCRHASVFTEKSFTADFFATVRGTVTATNPRRVAYVFPANN